MIRYRLSEAGFVRLTVYDGLGREMTRIQGHREAGPHRLTVDAGRWPGGVYLVRLEAAGLRRTRKMLLIR